MKSTKEVINVSLNKLQQQFDIFDEISLKNTAKVLDAFRLQECEAVHCLNSLRLSVD